MPLDLDALFGDAPSAVGARFPFAEGADEVEAAVKPYLGASRSYLGKLRTTLGGFGVTRKALNLTLRGATVAVACVDGQPVLSDGYVLFPGQNELVLEAYQQLLASYGRSRRIPRSARTFCGLFAPGPVAAGLREKLRSLLDPDRRRCSVFRLVDWTRGDYRRLGAGHEAPKTVLRSPLTFQRVEGYVDPTDRESGVAAYFGEGGATVGVDVFQLALVATAIGTPLTVRRVQQRKEGWVPTVRLESPSTWAVAVARRPDRGSRSGVFLS